MSVFRSASVSPVPALQFRVWSAESPGFNAERVFRSPAYEAGVDVSALREDDLRMMLAEHVTRLKDYSGRRSTVADDYISFTPSLVWALQYAHFKHYKRPYETVYVTVARTADYPPGTFVAALELFRDHGLPDRGPQDIQPLLRDRWNSSDWLARGYLSIDGKSSTVTLETLKTAGLHQLYPEFDEPSGRDRLALRVEELREQWQEDVDPHASSTHLHAVRPYRTTFDSINHVNKLSACFDQEYRVLMIVWFLALKNRSIRDLSFESEDLPVLDAAYTHNPFGSSWPADLLDLHQFEALVLQLRNNTRQHATTVTADEGSDPESGADSHNRQEIEEKDLAALRSRLFQVDLSR